LVLIVVLIIGLFEPWLANQISARLYARNAGAVSVPGPQASRVIVQDAARVPMEGGTR
jgi:hypothetical protein